MNILDDPRQFPTRLEWPTTYEGAEEYGKWDAKFMDLDELPVEEYMKPMPVNVVSGGTTPGPTPTPSGETKYFTAKFMASGTSYGTYSIASGQTVPASQVPKPTKDGYNFSGWTPDPATTVITANTTFNGWFIKDALYASSAMSLSGSEIDMSEYTQSELNAYLDGITIGYTIPASDDYISHYEEMEETGDEDAFWDWFNNEFAPNNQYVIRVILPEGYGIESAVDEGGNRLDIVTPPTEVEYEGKSLYCHEIAKLDDLTVFVPSETEQEFRITVKIKKTN